MGSNSLFEYNQILNQLKTYTNIPHHLISSFTHFNLLIYRSDQQNRFSQPMLWIGIYIALASLLCTLAMVVDLVHGIRNRKLWFPCKYFTLNAASLSLIAIAIKLPMDLNNSMPGQVDLDAKVESLAFMCTMMANMLPSLATMDNKELLTNIVALGVLVITLVVNVCMQINTGLLSLYHHEELLVTNVEAKDRSPYMYACAHRYGIVATIYVDGHCSMQDDGFHPNFLCDRCLVWAYGIRGWKWMKAMLISEGTHVTPGQMEKFKDLQCYILTLEDDIELAERTLKGITKSVNLVIRKAEKHQPNNLKKLIEECGSFNGDVPPLQAEDRLSCWSLTLVTLATVAVSLPNIPKETSDRLLSSVGEGLLYVTLVEETFNASDEYVSMRKAAKSLWLEVEVYHKWLGNKLRKLAPQVKTARQILEYFKDTAENMTTEVESLNVCENSMSRTTKTILFSYHATIDKISQEELFCKLSSMIADILATCLTNLPQVIAMKCHTDVIEKREASVHAAARLLGETMQIINTLQHHQLPRLNTDELPVIDKWRAYLKHPFP
uniref:Uncharacterized protein n=1 Tax=Helianthus annuus TaxID=4232 RepID=A0A251U0G0_HELAN